MFYVLDGDLTFHCGGESFDIGAGSFVFRPHGVEHGYQIRGESDARLLVVTAALRKAAGGWAGFLGDVERDGTSSSPQRCAATGPPTRDIRLSCQLPERRSPAS